MPSPEGEGVVTPKGVATDEESANVYSKTKRREINPRPIKYNNLYLTAIIPNFNCDVPINTRLFFVSSYAIINLLKKLDCFVTHNEKGFSVL